MTLVANQGICLVAGRNEFVIRRTCHAVTIRIYDDRLFFAGGTIDDFLEFIGSLRFQRGEFGICSLHIFN